MQSFKVHSQNLLTLEVALKNQQQEQKKIHIHTKEEKYKKMRNLRESFSLGGGLTKK